ncbi:TPA: hypothetical protein ACNIOJ_004592 [Pseudomonas aeruginosa]
MNATDITSIFGVASDDGGVSGLFKVLNTLRRPQRPDASHSAFYDWTLIRRKGLELGLVDEEFQLAASRFRWGHGRLLLAQAYFYSGADDIQPFSGCLPEGLAFSDSRNDVLAKLSLYEGSRHSYINDTWDLDGYRLTVTYKDNASSIDQVICRLLPNPIVSSTQIAYPKVEKIHNAFGCSVHDQAFIGLWSSFLKDGDYDSIENNGELDLNDSFGASLGFAKSGDGALFRSITFHRNRDQESVGWGGVLPRGLDFEDSPTTLFSKISSPPAQQANTKLTGYSVWHFEEYTLHVLFSNVDNRLVRVKMIAPGTWKCMEDYDE